MLKAYKTEIDPSPEQIQKIRKTIGVCRFVFNLFIETNQTRYSRQLPYMPAYDFSKYLNHEYMTANPDKQWIKSVSSKAVKKSITNADAAFKKFFKKQANYPKFKKKNKSDPAMYFVNAGLHVERHRIKIPTIGWVKLKEFGYIPTQGKFISGTITQKAGRYYVSVLTETAPPELNSLSNPGLGIDMGVKNLAVVSDGHVFKNINNRSRIKNLEKKLRREQRRLSRKYESSKKSKKGNATRQNIQKQQLKIARIHHQLNCIRTDYENKVINTLVRTKPAYIALEDLNVSGMMKNRHLSKAIANQRFTQFRTKLITKAKTFGIEIRLVDRWYASSKTCHNCGYVHQTLKLSDRTYVCPCCKFVIDRDMNAAMNIRDTNCYKPA